MRVLFLFAQDASFVRMDLAILREFSNVTAFHAAPGMSLFRAVQAMLNHDLVFAWFGVGHAARAVAAGQLMRKPSIVVGGGWDVADMPEIGYGASRGAYGRTRASITFGLATKVLAFSDWSSRQILEIAPRARVETVYLGVDCDRWQPANSKEQIVLSVGKVTTANLRRKGLETFARASRIVTEARFVVAGPKEPDAAECLTTIGGPNLVCTGELSENALRDLVSRARVYVQASYTEGFGLALAEAMSAACVPVVTRLGALPEVVGDCGLYVPYENARATADAIRSALDSDLGMRARARVQGKFEIKRRKARIRALLRELEPGVA